VGRSLSGRKTAKYKVQIFSVKHIQFIVKKHIQGDMFRLYRAIIRPFCRNRAILTEKNLHFVYIQEHIGMTNVKEDCQLSPRLYQIKIDQILHKIQKYELNAVLEVQSS